MAERGAVEQAEQDRPSGEQRPRARHRLAGPADLHPRLAEPPLQRLAQGWKMRGIRFVIGEAGEMDPSQRREVPQQMPGADLVAPVRRVGNAVGEEEDVAHQPRPRAIGGPRTLASHSGSRFQVST